MSHPIRVRGLKQTWSDYVSLLGVAPYTGAWIETEYNSPEAQFQRVAPYTGAWIETSFVPLDDDGNISRTLYGCVD